MDSNTRNEVAGSIATDEFVQLGTNSQNRRRRKRSAVGDGLHHSVGSESDENALDHTNPKPPSKSIAHADIYDGKKRLDINYIVQEILHQNKPVGKWLTKPLVGIEAIVKKIEQFLHQLDKLPVFFQRSARRSAVYWKDVKDYYVQNAFTQEELEQIDRKTIYAFEEMIGRLFINQKWNNVTCAMIVKLIDAHDHSKVALIDNRILAKAQPIIETGWSIWALPITLPVRFKNQFPGSKSPEDDPVSQSEYEAMKNCPYNFNPVGNKDETLTTMCKGKTPTIQTLLAVPVRRSHRSIRIDKNPPLVKDLVLQPRGFDEPATKKAMEDLLSKISSEELEQFINNRDSHMQQRCAKVNSMQKEILNMKEEMYLLSYQKDLAEKERADRESTYQADREIMQALGPNARAKVNELKLKLAEAMKMEHGAATVAALQCFTSIMKSDGKNVSPMTKGITVKQEALAEETPNETERK